MTYATCKYTGNEAIPAEITLGEHTTPVWIQQKWEDGQYAEYVRKNGCGHCCTTMVLNLYGIKLDPHEEFTTCRKLWGEPKKGDDFEEFNFISTHGIAKVLKHFGIPAQCCGVPVNGSKAASEQIYTALTEGKLVIFWSHPSSKLPDNPFSPGEHYVLAVGLDEDGKILVANSSQRGKTRNGIQFTDRETIAAVLYEGCQPGEHCTWGRHPLHHSSGYVIVG